MTTQTNRTEYDFGAEYARSLPVQDRVTVDIEAECTSTEDVPTEDYLAMRQSGIVDPDSRAYWRGFNSEC